MYKSGVKNIVADSLSRRSDLYLNAFSTVKLDLSILKEEYVGDKYFEEVYCALSSEELRTKNINNKHLKRYKLNEGLLYFDGRLCIPKVKDYRFKILREAHDTPISGHLGSDKT